MTATHRWSVSKRKNPGPVERWALEHRSRVESLRSRKGRPSVWVVVFVAAGQEEGERVKEMLVQGGVLASIRSAGLGGPVEVLVPEGEIEEAQEVLSAHQGG